MILFWIELAVFVFVMGVGVGVSNWLGWGTGGFFCGVIFTFLLAQIFGVITDWYKEEVSAEWEETYKQADESFRAEVARFSTKDDPPQSRH